MDCDYISLTKIFVALFVLFLSPVGHSCSHMNLNSSYANDRQDSITLATANINLVNPRNFSPSYRAVVLENRYFVCLGLRHNDSQNNTSTCQVATGLPCMATFVPFNDSCYLLSPASMSYAKGQQFCEENMGLVAPIRSAPTHAFLAVMQKASGISGAWFGLQKLSNGSQWVYSNGQPMQESDYGYQKSVPEGTVCVALSASSGYYWTPQNCSTEFAVVCSYSDYFKYTMKMNNDSRTTYSIKSVTCPPVLAIALTSTAF